MNDQKEKYIRRCLELAKLGEGRTAPNPMVGSVIVHEGKIIGEGFHQQYGSHHAEVNAIISVKNQELLPHSTLYVNLEPCAHFGKTPPCADLIVEKKIQNVVIGTSDPFAMVAGKGIEKLKKAGCNVDVGVLTNECLELNRRFFTFHDKKRPYIILKWAQTADGYVDRERDFNMLGEPTWITNEIARIAVHKQRSTEQAIFVGTKTVLKDNPSLTLRDWFGKQPIRITVDNNSRLSSELKIFSGDLPSIVCTTEKNKCSYKNLTFLSNIKDLITDLMNYLYTKEIQSIIIEGGPETLQKFIDRNLWDEAHVYMGDKTFGSGIKAPTFIAKASKFEQLYNSELNVYRNNGCNFK